MWGMIPYEQAVAEFNAKKDAEEKARKDEHDNAHCPKGEHVWGGGFLGIRVCMICDQGEDYGLGYWQCPYCGPCKRHTTEARANELRKFLWDGQKAGTVAAPIAPKALMSFLWRRAK
jgi:hypothetical protein